ncbi:hypothetical protein ABFV99_00535 [Cytobacillus horneckiae]|uniref:hypothetical protein n=1 Tax=Cytobacillus horneckiae TaxID=549687 RepID=UPI0034CE23FB
MEYSKLFSILMENQYPDCWVSSTGWEEETRYTFALRDDISITIEEMPKREDNRLSNEFTEKFINETASYHHYALKYNGGIVKTFWLYMVDGGRALIPCPKLIQGNFIEDDDLIFAVIVDRLVFNTRYENEDTTAYMDRAEYVYQKSLVR